MNEPIEQAGSQHAAWTIRGEPASNGYAVRIGRGPTSDITVAPGHWALALGKGERRGARYRMVGI
jgi:hypothetical protein